jgi:hypothetical protein
MIKLQYNSINQITILVGKAGGLEYSYDFWNYSLALLNNVRNNLVNAILRFFLRQQFTNFPPVDFSCLNFKELKN